jgi:ribosome maturation factor RimP
MEERIFDAVKAPLEAENIELVEVRFGEEDGEKTLFVVIDSENGVDLDLCVKATHIVDPIIESLDLEIEDYVLDVGSKGVSLEDEN